MGDYIVEILNNVIIFFPSPKVMDTIEILFINVSFSVNLSK